MSNAMKKLLAVLAVAMCFITVQNVCAETLEVSGVITEISTSPNMVNVEGTEVYGIKLNYLCNQYNICLEEGEIITLTAYEYTCSDGSIKLKATSITVGEVTVQLR